jgi:hypothetical protein
MMGRVIQSLATKASQQGTRLLLTALPPIAMDSCHRLLVEIATELTRQPTVSSLLRKTFSPADELAQNQMRLCKPLQFIDSLLTLFDEEVRPSNGARVVLCLVFPNFDQYRSLVVSEALQCLARHPQQQQHQKQPVWSVLVVAGGSHVSPPSVSLDEAFQAVSSCAVLEWTTPMELYNNFLLDLLPSNKLPVHFPPAVVTRIHDDFVHFHACVSSVIDRCECGGGS